MTEGNALCLGFADVCCAASIGAAGSGGAVPFSLSVPAQNVIGKQKAQEIALADAGVAAEDALHLIVKPDWDDGVRI